MHFGTPIPISADFALTREEYSIWRRVSKSKAPKAFTNGAEISLRAIAISTPQRPSHLREWT